MFEEKSRQAERETLGYENYLLELLERECQERRANRITRLLKASHLPLEKTMENFDSKRLPVKTHVNGGKCQNCQRGMTNPVPTPIIKDSP